MNQNMRTSEVLNRAADLIQTRGWATVRSPGNPWGEHTGPVCMEGAIFAAVERPELHRSVHKQIYAACPAYAAVTDYLTQIDERVYRPFVFNDSIAESANDVIGVLRACALIEQSREQSRILGEPAEDTEKVGHESRSESGVSAFSNHGLDAGAAA